MPPPGDEGSGAMIALPSLAFALHALWPAPPRPPHGCLRSPRGPAPTAGWTRYAARGAAAPGLARCRMAEPDLPIAPLLPELVAVLDERPNVVLQAPPGAGKTTAAPLALLRDSAWLRDADGVLLVLEPRRVAARGAATRMAAMLGEQVGQTVGYRVRQESRVSSRTKIVVVTEGILLRQLQNDPLLQGIAGVCFDEFHERSSDGDLCLTLCLEAQRQALPELRLLVMSATLGDGLVEQLASLLDATTLVSEGRGFPVSITHDGRLPLAAVAAMRPRELAATVAPAVLKVLSSRPSGDVLVFLPGEGEIRQTTAALSSQMGGRLASEVEVTPLYAALPLDQQTRAVLPHAGGKRRVVLATSIAESSLTLPGVTAVVDSGLRRISCYEPATGMSGLKTVAISAASAAQRTGRAGRVAPGICVRLWSEREALAPHTPPQILLDDLAGFALTLAAWGAPCPDTVGRLPWLTPPPPHALSEAHQLLQGLGAIKGDPSFRASSHAAQGHDGQGGGSSGGGAERAHLTAHGRALVALPVHPRSWRVLACARCALCAP